jgi:hypothetical protein
MGISLKRLEQKKLALGINKLSVAGIDVERWLAMCNADAVAMQRLVAAWPVRLPSFVYDAKVSCSILGLSNNCEEEAPKAADGEVVVWYGGWTLGELLATGKVFNYLSKEWEERKAPAGYYRTRIPVPGSSRKTHEERIAHLNRFYAAFKELPTPVGATALAVHLGVTGEDLLKGDFCACAEALPDGRHAVLTVDFGRVRACCYGDGIRGNIWLASSLLVAPRNS